MEQQLLTQPRRRLVSTGVLCFALAGGFIALFSGLLGGPRPSSADPTGQGRIRLQQREKANADRNALATRPDAEGRLLGELTGAQYRVRITSSPDGARYAVLSLDGSVLLENATLEEAAAAFPELDLTSLQGGPDEAIIGPLMLAEPERQ